jgi:hypothetical protein
VVFSDSGSWFPCLRLPRFVSSMSHAPVAEMKSRLLLIASTVYSHYIIRLILQSRPSRLCTCSKAPCSVEINDVVHCIVCQFERLSVIPLIVSAAFLQAVPHVYMNSYSIEKTSSSFGLSVTSEFKSLPPYLQPSYKLSYMSHSPCTVERKSLSFILSVISDFTFLFHRLSSLLQTVPGLTSRLKIVTVDWIVDMSNFTHSVPSYVQPSYKLFPRVPMRYALLK